MTGLSLCFTYALAVFALATPAQTSPVIGPEPIRCATCTPEELGQCPAVPANCRVVLKEPGCGCCLACALEKGDSCGVYTAHCATGLHCSPRPGDPRPIHSLTRGHGTCTELEEDEGTDHGSLHHLLDLNKPLNPMEAQESLKARVNAIQNKLHGQMGPCHTELHAALAMIVTSQQKLGEKFTSFYLPNCDKHGFYKAKQCETSLVGQSARCWCVSSWNGKQIQGSSDIPGDAQCHQEATH
ncbi:insulin-like growth factor-binding protein 1b isoform X2 [Clupea harengus]|uniref:Insulin-like growth factor-binding protein 1 n=1 Tax=Clupea harengus TaxID=7950 RepID=A0A6P3VVC5_CLUHA|nr:insulin-like growth factor-binding protein 1b isoform X2 [Clupea harengus]